MNQTVIMEVTSAAPGNQTRFDENSDNNNDKTNYRLAVGLSCVLVAVILIMALIVYLKWKTAESYDSNTPNVFFQRGPSIIRFQRGGRDL